MFGHFERRSVGVRCSASHSSGGRRRGPAHSGTLTGTLRDLQGGIIPGAAVTLTSDAKGTSDVAGVHQRPMAISSSPMWRPTATRLQIELPGFKTIKRSGLTIAPGPGALGDGHHGSRQPDRYGHRRSRVTARQTQSGERSFTGRDQVGRSLPIAKRSFVSSRRSPRCVTARRVGDRSSTVAAQQHHDGRRVDDGHPAACVAAGR